MKTIYKVNDVEIHIRHFYKFIEGVNEMPFELVKHKINEERLRRFLEMGVGKADNIIVEIYGRSYVDVTYINGDNRVVCFINEETDSFAFSDMNYVDYNDSGNDFPALEKALNELAETNPNNATLKHSDIDFRKLTAIKLAKKFNVVTVEYQQGGNDVFHLEFEYTPSFAQALVMSKHQKKHEVMLAGYEFFIEEWRQSHPDSVLDKRNK
nr:MAG TPA: hypothetical protein [Caudoviricetes sp.]